MKSVAAVTITSSSMIPASLARADRKEIAIVTLAPQKNQKQTLASWLQT
jgi:hypothetical protein